MSTFLEVFFAFVAGGITLWGLLQVEKYLKRRRDGDAWLRDKGVRQDAYAGLRAMGTKLEQAAARLSKPHVGPPPVQRPPAPKPWPPAEPAPWPHGNFFDHADEPPGDMKGY